MSCPFLSMGANSDTTMSCPYWWILMYADGNAGQNAALRLMETE